MRRHAQSDRNSLDLHILLHGRCWRRRLPGRRLRHAQPGPDVWAERDHPGLRAASGLRGRRECVRLLPAGRQLPGVAQRVGRDHRLQRRLDDGAADLRQLHDRQQLLYGRHHPCGPGAGRHLLHHVHGDLLRVGGLRQQHPVPADSRRLPGLPASGPVHGPPDRGHRRQRRRARRLHSQPVQHELACAGDARVHAASSPGSSDASSHSIPWRCLASADRPYPRRCLASANRSHSKSRRRLPTSDHAHPYPECRLASATHSHTDSRRCLPSSDHSHT